MLREINILGSPNLSEAFLGKKLQPQYTFVGSEKVKKKKKKKTKKEKRI